MLDLQIRKQVSWFWIYLSALAAVLSFGFGVWLGPYAVFWLSGIGLIPALTAFILRFLQSDRYPAISYSSWLFGFHTVLLIIALALQSLFLMPLPEETLKLPRFSKTHIDPAGLFEVRGPSGWNSSLVTSPTQTGVRFQPAGRDQYIGASDIQILVQVLDKAPKSKELFLKKIASSLIQERQGNAKKSFELNIGTAELLRGGKGVWSILEVKRLWVPLQQVSLFGLKNDRYLCSISITGLKSHSTLYKVLCIALFEKLRILSLAKQS